MVATHVKALRSDVVMYSSLKPLKTAIDSQLRTTGKIADAAVHFCNTVLRDAPASGCLPLPQPFVEQVRLSWAAARLLSVWAMHLLTSPCLSLVQLFICARGPESTKTEDNKVLQHFRRVLNAKINAPRDRVRVDLQGNLLPHKCYDHAILMLTDVVLVVPSDDQMLLAWSTQHSANVHLSKLMSLVMDSAIAHTDTLFSSVGGSVLQPVSNALAVRHFCVDVPRSISSV